MLPNVSRVPQTLRSRDASRQWGRTTGSKRRPSRPPPTPRQGPRWGVPLLRRLTRFRVQPTFRRVLNPRNVVVGDYVDRVSLRGSSNGGPLFGPASPTPSPTSVLLGPVPTVRASTCRLGRREWFVQGDGRGTNAFSFYICKKEKIKYKINCLLRHI